MKNLLFIISVCVCVTAATPTHAMKQLGPRRLIMLSDPEGYEHATSTSFAIMSGLIAGIEQQAAPILVSESLWHNFVIRRTRYKELKESSLASPLIYAEMIPTYGPALSDTNFWSSSAAKTALHRAYAAHFDYYKQALEIARTAPSVSRTNQLSAIKVMEPALQKDHPLSEIIAQDFVCYKTNFNTTEWSVYQLPGFAFLLIPASYQQRITQAESVRSSAFAQVTANELRIGLKIDHLMRVADPLALPDYTVSIPLVKTPLEANLNALFVTRKDLGLLVPSSKNKAHETYEQFIAPWNIYLTGHGFPDAPTAYQGLVVYKEHELKTYQEQFDTASMYVRAYEREIGTYEDVLKKSASTQDTRFYEQAIKMQKETIKNAHEIMKVTQHKIEGVKGDLTSLRSHVGTGGIIAGLYIKEFQTVLDFFNSHIQTQLFFYDTCFGSGKNLESPYQYDTASRTYNFVIASGASVDAPTTTNGAFIPTPPYYSNTIMEVSLDKRMNEVDIAFIFEQRFESYFSQLELYQNGMSPFTLAEILNKVHTFLSPRGFSYLHNVPLIRYPNTQWFSAVSMPDVIASITEQAVISHVAQNNKPFTLQGQESLLLYTPHIPVAVNIDFIRMPAILSMIGGNADHYFEEINAPRIALSQVIKNFLPIKDQYFTKRFFIKKLTCLIDVDPLYTAKIVENKGKVVTLHNVIIVQNDPNDFINSPKESLNIVMFSHVDEPFKTTAPYRAAWPSSYVPQPREIPNLEHVFSRQQAPQNLRKVKQSFEEPSIPPKDRAQNVAGRIKLLTFTKQKAVSLLQKYRSLTQNADAHPQALSEWISSLPEADQKTINLIQESQSRTSQPHLTKKEFDATYSSPDVQKNVSPAQASVAPDISSATEPLVQSLEKLNLNLNSVKKEF